MIFKQLKYLIILLLLTTTINCVFAQSINTTIDKKAILIGEQIHYNLSINLPSAEYKIDINIPDSIPHFEVLAKTSGDTTDKNGNYLWQQNITLTSFDSGSFSIPAFSYQINHLATTSQILYTDSFNINVGYMPIDKGAQPRDIKSVIEVTYFNMLYLLIGIGVIVIIILAIILYLFINRRMKKGFTKIDKTAYQIAMKQLDILQKANTNNELPVKEYHSKLAEVLRNYYGKTQNQNFLNKTTEEVLAKLKTHQLKAETAAQTIEALATGDAVKFAKYHSSFVENEAALNYLKNTITEIELSRNKKD